MKKTTFFILIFTFFSAACRAEYPPNPYVDETTWNDLKPFFLPEDMDVKTKLDKLFTSRVTQNLATLRIAGFKLPPVLRKPSHVLVIRHPKLKGYLLKLYTDDNGFVGAHFDWLRRIHGANYVRAAIDRLGYQHLFKVPHKWIYPIPAHPGPLPGSYRQNFLLVVEDMHIFSSMRNEGWWRSIAMTKELIDAIYTIFQEVGLSDSVYPDNVPFCRDRKMAFVDTQHFHKWPIHFEKLLPFFSKQMQEYWLKLIQYGGPKNVPSWEPVPSELLDSD